MLLLCLLSRVLKELGWLRPRTTLKYNISDILHLMPYAQTINYADDDIHLIHKHNHIHSTSQLFTTYHYCEFWLHIKPLSQIARMQF